MTPVNIQVRRWKFKVEGQAYSLDKLGKGGISVSQTSIFWMNLTHVFQTLLIFKVKVQGLSNMSAFWKKYARLYFCK